MRDGEKYYIHSAVEIAEHLFDRHFHNEDGRIIYHEKDVIELLHRLGHPSPDWEGNAKQLEKETRDENLAELVKRAQDLELGY